MAPAPNSRLDKADSSQLFTADDSTCDASPRIIFELKNVQNDVCEIGEHVQRMEDQMTSVLQMMEHLCRLMVNKDKQKQKIKKDTTPKNAFRKVSTEKEISDYINLSRALQENILLFIENLSLKESLLLDRLVEKDCLTEEECNCIRSFGNSNDGIRSLIRTIKRRDTRTIFDFLETVGLDSPHLKIKVEETYNDKQNQGIKDRQQLCPTCLMTKIVDLKDIVDVLWKENLLSDQLYDIVIEDAERLRELVWNTILHGINKRNNSEQNIRILIKALESKYTHIANLLKGQDDTEQGLTQLQCCCYRSAVKRKRLAYAGSSTTSSQANTSVANVPKLFLLDHSGSLEESAEETEPKLEKLKESFDYSDLSRYDDSFEEHRPIPRVVSEDVLNKNVTVDMEEMLSRKRHRSEPFSIKKDKTTVDVIGNPSLFNRTVSTVVVCEADSTVTDTGSKVEREINTCNLNVNQSEEKHNATKTLELEAILHKMRRTTSGAEANNDGIRASNCEFDDKILEDLSSSRDAKQRLNRQQFYQRQMSAPAGLMCTESKSLSHLEANIGLRETLSKKSKRSLKRKERRSRNLDPLNQKTLVAEQSAQGKIPYNPMWSKVPQSRNTCRWGYPEAKRFYLIETKMAEWKKQGIRSNSDTDIKVDETSTPDLSEKTV